MPRAGNIVAGRYRLTELSGEGSMGAVWKAVHVALGRTFAVKFLKGGAGQDAARLEERFLREARLAAAVRHRSVVDVVDVGRTNRGTPYMVMEHLDGETLAERLRRPPPVPVRELLGLMQQALLGLEAVHQAGVIHRDLKPDNVMLCRDGAGTTPKLVDFGVSQELEGKACHRSASGSRLTGPGTAVGTPWYMAPEQARACATIDRRADLYSAGVILYEGLAGQLPFEHDNVHLLLLLVMAGEATPIRTRRPDLPEALTALVARAMAVDPEARFASAAEMAAALGEAAREVHPGALCGRPTTEAPAPTASGPRAGDRPPPPAGWPAPARPATPGDGPAPPWIARVRRTRVPRPVLLGAGALAVTSALALAVGFGRKDPPERQGPSPIGPPAVVTRPAASAAPPSPILPPPPEARRTPRSVPARAARPAGERPPEMFRHPGF